MRWSLKWPGYLILVSALAFLGRSGYGQTTLGAIQGNVQDSSGALVPNTEVAATHLATSVVTRAVSTSAGAYRLPGLPVGTYRVTAEIAGFKRFTQEPVVVVAGTSSTLNIVLAVGDTAEVIEVRGNLVTLETTSPQVGTNVEQRALLDLPLALSSASAANWGSRSRQFLEFVFLTPGVQGDVGSQSFNGSARNSQEILIDGISSVGSETPGRSEQIAPPYEAIGEFTVHTSNYSAEFGRGFGVSNFAMKSGTNQFHGNLFEFLRNDALDARGFFSPLKAPRRQNEYGGTLGGPVWIPSVYNGRNRTFFFFAYTGFRVRGQPSNPSIYTVPTLRQRQGDFSENLALGISIFDPASTRPDGKGGFVRDAYPGNVIPKARWGRIATQVNDLLPAPHFSTLTNNYIGNEIDTTDEDKWSLKLDHVFNERHKVSWSNWRTSNGSPSMAGVEGPWNPEYSGGYAAAGYRFGYDWIVSPSSVNHLGVGVTRIVGGRNPDPASAVNPFDIPGIPVGVKSYPTFTWTGYRGIGNSTTQPSVRWDTNINLNETFTHLRGAHQFKAGFSYSAWRANQLETILDGGWFSFYRGQTSQPNDARFSQWGNGYASFLSGAPAVYQRLVGGFVNGSRVKTYAWFAEDTWKLTRRLTLTLGVRHEIPMVLREANGRMSMFSLSAKNPANGLPGALIFSGQGTGRTGQSTFVDNRPWRHFAPRVGLAWQWNSRTVVRTGYGIAYAPGNATVVGRMTTLFKQGFVFQESVSSPDGFSPVIDLDGGVPAFTRQLPFLDPTLGNGLDVEYMNPDAGKMPYMQQWTFSIQRQLPGQVLADAAYVGNRGINLAWGGENPNQVDSKYLSLGSLLTNDINSAAAQAAGIAKPYAGFTGTVAQALRPYPHVKNIRDLMQPTGMSYYHALQAKLQRRFAGGYHLLTSYALSKSIAPPGAQAGLVDDSYQVPRDTANRAERSISQYDQTHVLVVSGGVDLPFGRGKRLVNRGGIVNKLVGGWTATAIARYASGFPLLIQGGSQLNLFGGANRPNRVEGAPMQLSFNDPARDLYLNRAAFVNTAPWTFGSLGIYLQELRGFRNLNEDIALLKRTNLTERVSLEFRSEFFNIFNRTIFRNPNTNFNDASGFGKVAGQSNYPRHIQFSMKLLF